MGRYASAPDLQALAADAAQQAASEQIIPHAMPSRAPAPGSPADTGAGHALPSSQGTAGYQPWSTPQANGNMSYTARPMQRMSGDGSASDRDHFAYVQKVIQKHGRQTAMNRQLRHSLRFLTSNWVLLLVLVISVAGMWVATGHRPSAKLHQ